MTASQLFTQHAYQEGDTRSLNYKVQCQNLDDLTESIKLIGDYNSFDPIRVISTLRKYMDRKDERGHDMYTFYIGREGSPVIYIEYFSLTHKESDRTEFKRNVGKFVEETFADEVDLVEKDSTLYEVRLWWD